MAKSSTVQRRIAGLLVALFAVLFLAGPLADAALCAADDIQAPPSAASHAAALASPMAAETVQAVPSSHHAEAPGVCQHGHAHAAGALADQAALAPVIRVSAIVLPPSPADQGIRFRLALGLERPPRV